MFTFSKSRVVRDMVFRWRTVSAAGAAALSAAGFGAGLLAAPVLG